MECLASYDPLCLKNPIGVISKGKTVNFKIEVDLKCVPNEAYLMIKDDNAFDYQYVFMNRNENYFEVSFEFKNSGHFWYNFKLNYNDFSKYLSKTFDNYSVVLDSKGEDFFQLVTEEEYTCNNSLQGGIIYQILPDRFCKAGEVKTRAQLKFREDWGGAIKKNTFDPVLINKEVFGGNLKGVIQKLNYLKELGITAIYFNPIFQANSHHKYDTADYMKIDEMLGTEEDFKELVLKANELGIKIILDGVYNHTGSDSVYFNKLNYYKIQGAYNSKNSKFYNWFCFRNYPDDYECWWGIDTLPKIKSDCDEYQEFITGENGVIEKYMKLGVAGIRLDVVDEITDVFTKKISNKIKSFGKDSVIMGEVWEDASTKISYSKRRKYFAENELNSVMNYPVRASIIEYIRSKDAFTLRSTMRMLLNNYPKTVLDNLMNFLGTHDTSRIFSELKNISNDNETLAKKLFKIAMGILFTLPGVPSIYYGDEYAMENNDGISRGCFDWNNYENELYFFVKELSKIRKLPVLKNGEFNILFDKNGKFVFERYNDFSHIVVLSNLKPSILKVELPSEFISFFTGEIYTEFEIKENQIEILIKK